MSKMRHLKHIDFYMKNLGKFNWADADRYSPLGTDPRDFNLDLFLNYISDGESELENVYNLSTIHSDMALMIEDKYD